MKSLTFNPFSTLFEPELTWVKAWVLCAALWLPLQHAHAEWTEIDKDDDVTHMWDKEAVKAVHVSRYVWTLSDYSKSAKTPGGDSYQSQMTRWRLIARTTRLRE